MIIRNPSALYAVRTARKSRRCNGFGCRAQIEPGQRYTRSALPPGADVNSSEKWWVHYLGQCCTPID